MSKKLRLASQSEEELLVYTFGANTPQRKKPKFVKFSVLLRDGNKMEIEAGSLPHLTNKQQRIALSPEDQEFIRKFLPEQFFADKVPFENLDFKPDVIIGQDYFWDFLTESPRTKLPSWNVCNSFKGRSFAWWETEDFLKLRNVRIDWWVADCQHVHESINQRSEFVSTA